MLGISNWLKPPLSNVRACKIVIGGIWALALWCSWQEMGLAGDGPFALVEMVGRLYFPTFEWTTPRFFPQVVDTIPIVAAIHLGVVDLHWLARLMTLGMYCLPIVLYTMALARTADDTVLLATTIAAIAMVFLATSFEIEAEHNAADAVTLAAGVWLVTARKLRTGDGIVLLALATLALKTYETFVYLGPLLAALTFVTVWRARPRPILPVSLYCLAGLLFVMSMGLSVDAIVNYPDREYLMSMMADATTFWRSLPFDLLVGSAVVVIVWLFVKPDDLRSPRPYLYAGIFLCLLALSPLLTFHNLLMRGHFSFDVDIARLPAGAVLAGVILFDWLYKANPSLQMRSLEVLSETNVSRRLLVFACAMFAAALPWQLVLVGVFQNYMEEVKTTIRNNAGIVAFEDLPVSSPLLGLYGAQVAYLGLVLRESSTDAQISLPRADRNWQPPDGLPNLRKFDQRGYNCS